jgi:hypothetical protein
MVKLQHPTQPLPSFQIPNIRTVNQVEVLGQRIPNFLLGPSLRGPGKTLGIDHAVEFGHDGLGRVVGKRTAVLAEKLVDVGLRERFGFGGAYCLGE